MEAIQRGLGLADPRTARTALKLFDDQQEALDAIVKAYHEGERSVLIQESTGSGKTVLAMFVMKALEQYFDANVFMVHRDELARQTVDKANMVNPEMSVGVVKAEQNELGRQLTVVSAQTLAHQRRLDQLVRSLPNRTLLFVDECQHAPSDSWAHSIKSINARFTLGLTATAYRADKKALGDVFGKIVHHTPMLVLVAQGRLKNPVGVRIDTEVDLDGVKTRSGDFAQDELDHAVDTEDRNQLIVESWLEHRHYDGQEFKRPVVFCVTRKHAEHLRDTFRANGLPAEMVLGDTPIEERQRIFKEFHDGNCVLLGVMVMSEGWDEPLADAAIMARPTKSLGLWVQCLGRIMRQSMGIDRALVLDFVDATSRHSLITLPTLAGHEAEGDVEEDEAEQDEREDGVPLDFLSMCQQVAKVRKLRSVQVNLFGQSDYVWGGQSGLWMTSAGSARYLALIPSKDAEGLFVPVEIQKPIEWGAHPTWRPLFDRPVEVDMARNLAEALVPMNPLTDRDAMWRQRPASPKQIRFAKRLGCALTPTTTMGEISIMIDQKLFASYVEELGLMRR